MLDREPMKPMRGVGVFGCDTEKGAADDLRAVCPFFELDQDLAQACGVRQEVRKGSIALLEVSEDKGVLAFEVAIGRGFATAGIAMILSVPVARTPSV